MTAKIRPKKNGQINWQHLTNSSTDSKDSGNIKIISSWLSLGVKRFESVPAVVKKHKRNISSKRDRKRVGCDICTYQNNNNNNIELYLYDHTSTYIIAKAIVPFTAIHEKRWNIFWDRFKIWFFCRSESERQEGSVNGSSRSRKVLVEDLSWSCLLTCHESK